MSVKRLLVLVVIILPDMQLAQELQDIISDERI